MADGIQKMYEHQEMKGYGGYEYVVRGAEVSCSYGSKTCVLNLKDDHGVHTSDGRPLITENDSTTDNIKGFGMCNKNRSKPCKCYPKLGKWWVTDNSNMKIFDTAINDKSDAVTEDSIAACNKGGIVSFKTSGQTSPSYDNVKIKDAVEIVEDEKKNWSRKSDKKDFIGHVKVKNSGIYNFCIYIDYNIRNSIKDLGSIFIYWKNMLGSIKYIGAYKLIEKVKESGEICIYAEIILNSGIEYYIEIDAPNMYRFDYVLKGNLDQHILKKVKTKNGERKEVSGVWVINKEHEDIYTTNYEKMVKENHHGVTRSIYYLNSWYAALLEKLINNIIDSRSMPRWVSNILNVTAIKVGIDSTNAGVALSALLLGFDNIYDANLKKFRDNLKKVSSNNDYIIIEVRSNRYPGDWIYELDRPVIVNNYYHYIFSGSSELCIGRKLEGAKYEKGSFKLLYEFDTSTSVNDVINNEIKRISDDIEGIN